jgi:hypothetical protein
MTKLHCIDHFLLNNHSQTNQLDKTIIQKEAYIRPLLFCLLFVIFCSNINAHEFKVAIFDTGFCRFQKKTTSLIEVEPTWDLFKDKFVNYDCTEKLLESPKFHGEKVLQNLLKRISTKNKIHFYPIVIFDESGKQSASLWIKANEYLKKHPMDLVVSAIGYPLKQDENNQLVLKILPRILESVWIVSAPRIGPGLNKDDNVYPQYLNPIENLFMAGDYFAGFKKDEALLYVEDIDFYEEDNPILSEHFNGTSYTVGIVAAKIINTCSNQKNSKLIIKCIKKHQAVNHLFLYFREHSGN